jgi:ribokinase
MAHGKPRVTVVGSNMVDLLSYLDRFPAAGETVFGKGFAQGFGGKGANQAVMAALLGAHVDMVTCVGDDIFGPKWIDHFKSFGVATDHVSAMSGIYSGVAAIWVEQSGGNRIVLGAGANDRLSPALVDKAFDKIERTDVVLSQLEVSQAAIARGFEHGRRRAAVTILNPGPAAPIEPSLLALTDWLLPNETELRLLADEMFGLRDEDDLALGRKFVAKTGIQLIITLGERGAVHIDPGSVNGSDILPAPKVRAVDTTGAGDAFAGAFAYGIAAGLPPARCISLAVAISADSVTKPGTSVSYAKGAALEALRAQS